MPSQKEFMIGCLIGGILGALGVAISANYSDQIESLLPNQKKRKAFKAKTHHASHIAHDKVKRATAKKKHSNKILKRKTH